MNESDEPAESRRAGEPRMEHLDPYELLRADDAESRRVGAALLFDRRTERAVSALLDALDDPSDRVSAEAARSLVDLGARDRVPAILKQLERPDRFRDERPGQVPYVRALLALAGPWLTELASGALKEADDAVAAGRLAVVLREIGDPEAIPVVERALRRWKGADGAGEDVETARVELRRALQGLREDAALSRELPSLDDIRRALDGGDQDERLAAERRLELWAGRAGTEALVEALADPRNAVSRAAARSLGVRGSSEAVPELVRQVARPKRCVAKDVAYYPYSESSDLEHSEHARALVRVGDRGAVQPLLDALADASNDWVAWEIVWVLGRLSDPRAEEALSRELRALQEADPTGWRGRELLGTLEEALARVRRTGGG